MKSILSQLRSACLTLIGLVGLAASIQAQTFYGLSFYDNQVITIDSSGTGSLNGTLGDNVNGYGLAYRGNQLLTFDPNIDRIREINPITAQLGASYNIGVGDLLGEGDLAFRSDGVGFLASALAPDFTPTNDLFRFDITTGTSMRIGSTNVTLTGLTFVGNTLYGLGKEADPSLYIVDQTNASLTAVGLLGISEGSPFGALTTGDNGQLYGVVDDRLYTIDAMSGHASIVSPDVLDLGFSSVSGLAFAPVPEPATYAMVGGFLLVGIVLRRRFSQTKKEVT